MDMSLPPSIDDDPKVPPVDELLMLEHESIASADVLLDKPPSSNSALWLIISLGAFVFAQAGGFDLNRLLILIGVLIFHESGHYLGMRLFGYRDVRMFFIPFFGAAVSGKKHSAPAWQQLLVTLLGPLPGIALGTALFFALRPAPDSTMQAVVFMLVGLNVFNLLPLLPLDGGRVMHLLIFRRHPLLEVVFRLTASAALGLLAWIVGSIVLGIIAAFVFMGTGFHFNVARRGRRLRLKLPGMSNDWKLTPTPERSEIFREARDMIPPDANPRNIGMRMLMLHEAAAARSPSLLATLGFLLLYLAGFVSSFGVGVALALERRDEQQRAAQQFNAELQEAAKRSDALLDQAHALESRGERAEAEKLRGEAAEIFQQALEKAQGAPVIFQPDAPPDPNPMQP